MKIRLIIRKFTTYGGAEAVAYRFARFLLEKNLLQEVICGKNEIKDFPGKIIEIGFLKPGRFLKTFSFQSRVKKYLQEKNERGIVNFTFSKVPGCHVYQNGGGTHIGFLASSIKAYSGLERFKKRISRFLNPINYYNPLLEKNIFYSSKRIIAVSNKVKEEIIRYYGQELIEKIDVIPNGVDVEKFNYKIKLDLRPEERKKLNFSNKDFVLGFASSNFRLKGLKYIIKALKLLPQNVKLVVAGGRNHKYYLNIAKKFEVSHRITFLGKVNNMVNFYSSLDCLVHPSFYDTFGNVITEALSMHIPVIVSQSTGAKDFIVHGKNGFILSEIEEREISLLIRECMNFNPDFSVNHIPSDNEVFHQYISVAEQSLSQEQT